MQAILRKITDRDVCFYSIERLKKWRIKNRFAYSGNYEITHDSVRKWLQEFVLDKSDRILYWVVVNGQYIGHMGLNSIKKDSVQIDNVARGVSKYKGIMHKALQTLIEANSEKKIWLKVLPNNQHAIDFYKENGFKEEKIEEDFLIMLYE